MKIIDLSHILDNNTPVSSYDTPLSLERTKHLHKDSYNDSKLISTMHIGTHIDAPSHMLDSRINISDIPLHNCIREGVVLDCRNQMIIDVKDEYHSIIKQGSIVLLYSSLDLDFGKDVYYSNHPVLTEAFCDLLIEKQVPIIGLDFYSPDTSPFDIHKKLLSHNILIVENLTNLQHLLNKPSPMVHIIPMPLKAEGAFVRAYAIVEEE